MGRYVERVSNTRSEATERGPIDMNTVATCSALGEWNACVALAVCVGLQAGGPRFEFTAKKRCNARPTVSERLWRSG